MVDGSGEVRTKMGILGCRTMMDEDPSRFTTPFTWNCVTGPLGSNQNNNEWNSLGLLIDGKSFLYHIVMGSTKDLIYASPATINESCQVHIHRLLRVVGKKGGVHIFFDGLAPLEKLKSQLKRMSEESMVGDMLGRQDVSPDSKRLKLLHHLAEWAFLEAIDALKLRFSTTLFVYRPAKGEGEAMMNQWLVQNDGLYSRVSVISEDSDFLVYESCPGFIPPSSLWYKEENGKHCLEGTYYLRSKFLLSFLGHPATTDTTIMTTVAAIAGCDYIDGLEESQLKALSSLRHTIVNSSIGGLRFKKRKNATAMSALTAILRVVAHYKSLGGYQWKEHMCSALGGDLVEETMIALRNIHSIYFYSLQINPDSAMDIVPGMVEVRRLLQLGIFVCYPVVESFRRDVLVGDVGSNDLDGSNAVPVLPCPPLTSEIENWITTGSIWNFPHFRQIRARLYSYVRLIVHNGQIMPAIPPADLWAFDRNPVIKEIVRIKDGVRWRMESINVNIPHHTMLATLFKEQSLTLADDDSIYRGVFFCLTGTPYELRWLMAMKRLPVAHRLAFLASAMLPYNLACLFLMMSTAPKEIAQWDFPLPLYSSPSCSELKKVLPVLSVAYAHVNLLVNTLLVVWNRNGTPSSLLWPPLNVSSTFRHDTALLIWDALRLQMNLEYLTTPVEGKEKDVVQYLGGCFTTLGLLRSEDVAWQKVLAHWRDTVGPLYDAWWEIFNNH